VLGTAVKFMLRTNVSADCEKVIVFPLSDQVPAISASNARLPPDEAMCNRPVVEPLGAKLICSVLPAMI
jgi:hypothetical protein